MIEYYLTHYILHFFSVECLSGKFGPNCRERCSGHCINNVTCNHISGVCPGGCEDGYIGALCNIGMLNSDRVERDITILPTDVTDNIQFKILDT